MREIDLGTVIEREQLADWAQHQHVLGKTIAFTNGCFDLIHSGHLYNLATAAATADLLLVALNSDTSVTGLKGAGRPLLPETERAALIASLRPVSAVTIFPESTPLETIALVRPDVLVKGSEYKENDIVGAREVTSWGGKVVRVPMQAGWSTSRIIATIKNLE